MASYAITWRKSTKKDLRKIRPDDVPGIVEAVERWRTIRCRMDAGGGRVNALWPVTGKVSESGAGIGGRMPEIRVVGRRREVDFG